MYQQHYNPTGNFFLSVIVAAIPIATLLYFIALHPHRDKQGNKHLGISAPYAAFYGVIAAFLVSCIPFGMPLPAAISAFVLGSLSGFLGIIWIIIGAIFLYNMTLIAQKFEIVKESIIHISFDRRLQVLLIAFSFGAIIEGTSGFGTPVAIAGAVMVGLGFSPFQSAVLNLLANTAPVAWGAIGTPIVTLAAVSGLDQLKLSSMAGHQLPFCSVLVPFWLVTTFVLMEGGTWKEAWEVWPGTLCSGVSFAVMQWFASSTMAFHLMTDVVSGVFSVICTALFLRFVWHPKTRFLLRSEREALAKNGKSIATATTDSHEWKYPYTVGQTINAWTVVKIKERTKEKHLWARLVGSTFAGQLGDTLVFCSIAAGAIGITSFGDFATYTVLGWFYKTGVEVVMLPITYRVIAYLKRHEPTYTAMV